MGACTFYTMGEGRTAREAFRSAQIEAMEEHGSRGYTGSIAEKDGFVLVDCPESVRRDPPALREYIEDLLDRRFYDKWGPAGCIQISEGLYEFFGWASS